MYKKYLQRRSHRFTQGRIPLYLIYIKNVAVKDNKIVFLGNTTSNIKEKNLVLSLKTLQKHVYYIHMKADSNTFSLHIPRDCDRANLLN